MTVQKEIIKNLPVQTQRKQAKRFCSLISHLPFHCYLQSIIFNKFFQLIFQNKNGENGSTNIARVILSNFNIFSNKNSIENHRSNNSIQTSQKNRTWDAVLDIDSSSTKSGRRPSVDTVSTYLSHENPVDLLDNSVGSDEVYKDSVVG